MAVPPRRKASSLCCRELARSDRNAMRSVGHTPCCVPCFMRAALVAGLVCILARDAVADDAGPPDAGAVDGGSVDAAPPDAASPDAAPPETPAPPPALRLSGYVQLDG